MIGAYRLGRVSPPNRLGHRSMLLTVIAREQEL
jgi:hypothetical protein